ncbi:MAG: YraN family protein [Aggregatilineales bacterium]
MSGWRSDRQDRRAVGSAGEALALKHLRAAGYEILATGWRCFVGEIDIVARQNGEFVFVEVRARYAAEQGAALESIGKRKQAKLVRTAQAYLADQHLDDAAWRIDVVAITFERGQPAQVEIVENAVGW